MNRYTTPLFFFLLLCQGVHAQLIDKTVATVKLEKTEVISLSQFKQKVEEVEKQNRAALSLEDKKKLLDLMISEILINQASAKENIASSQAEIDARIKVAKQSGGMQMNLNRELTDAELKSLVQQSGFGWEEYLKQLQKAIIQQKFVMLKKKPFFDTIKEPSAEEIEDVYQSNKTTFVAPDIVRFKHIFFDTRNLNSKEEKDKARNRAEEVYRELRNGASFDELVVKYSDDKSSRYKGGDFGYLFRDDKAKKQLLGKDFFEAPFLMKVGEISEVLQSNIGYHIIKISENMPFKVLGLNDPIPPLNKTTVKDEIKDQLLQRKQAELYQKAVLEVIDELKKKAEIKTFENNLTW